MSNIRIRIARLTAACALMLSLGASTAVAPAVANVGSSQPSAVADPLPG